MKITKCLCLLVAMLLLSSCVFFSNTVTEITTNGISAEEIVTDRTVEERLPFQEYYLYNLSEPSPYLEELLRNNPIDKDFLMDEKKAMTSTISEVDFIRKYGDIWDVECKTAYEKLEKHLKGDALRDLQMSQDAWLEWHMAEANLASEIFLASAGQGTVRSILIAYQAVGRVRYRTWQLVEYCIMMGENFRFEYESKY